jgi:TolB-like protein
MDEKPVQRRLAAILAADVVGFGRLMEADEAGTLSALKSRRRDILNPLVARHGGRLFKVTGDGVLVEFASAVNAVRCAVDLQQSFAAANADLANERHVVLRIGIHIGDIMVEGGDLYGDGVNIAARLEGLAEPGGVLLSEDVQRQVRNKLSFGFVDVGPLALKSIADPVRAYSLNPLSVAGSKPPVPALPDKPSIAVLPFINMSGDPGQEYFSDGITEDIITELARFHSLFVIARNSSFQYRGKNVDVRLIGRELGVRYLVEGSIRRSEDRVRVTAQLIEADTGTHLWADRYDRVFDDIFEIQDELIQAIVSAIPRMVSEAHVERNRGKSPEILAAYDYVLRGEWHQFHSNSTANPDALAMFKRALDIDPDCARAHSNIAYQYAYDPFHSTVGAIEKLQLARRHVERALDLDDSDSATHETAAFVYLLLQEYDLAERHSILAVRANPNDRYAAGMRGLVVGCLGDPQSGIEWLLKARRLDPRALEAGREPLITVYYLARRYPDAIEEFRQWRAPPPHVLLDASALYAQAGLASDAERLIERFNSERPANFNTVDYVRFHLRCYKRKEDRDHWREGYIKAGLSV